jgi:hypothetical protein
MERRGAPLADLPPLTIDTLAGLAADAARLGDVDTLERSLEAGVAADAVTARGDSLLMLAAFHDRPGAVALLLERGADPNGRDAAGQTPLAGVAVKGLVPIAALLIEAGAVVDSPGPDGRTPLMTAAAFDHGDMVEWLLAQGASRSARDAAGLSAFDIALARGATAAAEILTR